MSPQSERTQAFRRAISDFIEERRTAKKVPKGDPRYDYQTWVKKAATDAYAIQFATHVAKITHSSSQASSIYAPPDTLSHCDAVARNALGENFPEDASAQNAAALYVVAFLNLKVEGKRLLNYVMSADTALRDALAQTNEQGDEMMEAFASVVAPPKTLRVDTLMKQVLWLTGNDPVEDQDFIVLAPLACSSLMHKLYTSVQSANFSEESKEARKARREGKPSDHPCIFYHDVVEWHVGGANPQNVSPLNSARRGISYLLSSLPPKWKARSVPDLRGRDSAVPIFIRSHRVCDIVKELATFLKTRPAPNLETRKRREIFEDDLCQALAEFTESVRAYEGSGWTEAVDCRLSWAEKVWLDPGFVDGDIHEAGWHDRWVDEVSTRIANALNAALAKQGVVGMGDVEFMHWYRVLLTGMVHGGMT
ncbi:type I-F CRISPR-associated protein Csy1 [Acetobacter sp. AAB5]|uniref:type I-F CRISPR-associated protein Csy1 n=1 Tax=Acetobacter sp. AAB5 TaxID=3418370 RepID=UPI003CFA8A72